MRFPAINQAGQLLACVAAAIFVCAAALAYYAVLDSRRAANELLHSQRNNLLLMQQLQQLSIDYLERDQRSEEQLNNRALEDWLRFDQQFVRQNRGQPGLEFEVATTARRAAYVSTLLHQVDQSQKLLTVARENIDALSAVEPANLSYLAERAAVALQQATSHNAAGNAAATRAACNAARKILLNASRNPTEETDTSLQPVLIQAVETMLQLDEDANAKLLADELLTVAERLLQNQPQDAAQVNILQRARSLHAQVTRSTTS